MGKEVIFETENAIFRFKLPDAVERLRYYSSEHRVNEATESLKTISSSSSKEVKIASDHFAYIVLDLLRQKKGSVYCKSCQKDYEASQLRSVPLGLGRTPFEINIEKKRSLYKRFLQRQQLICGSGGERYLCPHGHELIGTITWTGMLRVPR